MKNKKILKGIERFFDL